MRKEFYRVDEIASLFQLGKSTVYRHIKDKKIKGFRVGGSIRVSIEEVERVAKKNARKQKKQSHL